MTDPTSRRHARLLIEQAIDSIERRTAEQPGVLSRRGFVTVSVSSLAAAFLAACNSEGPRSAEAALRFATRRNEVVERWLLRHTSMDMAAAGAHNAKNRFPSYFVSKVVPTWDEHELGPWHLLVEGMVARPLKLTLAELMQLPSVEQRVDHFCVEGWTAVASFRGVPIRDIARLAGALPGAKVVDFSSFDDGYHESWDIESATHPQTILVYAKDGNLLTPPYGAPARVHSPIKLGYKNTKYVVRIDFLAERNGGYWSDRGYEWFGGT